MDDNFEVVKEITNDAGTFHLRVVPDPDGMNPRDHDANLGVMVADVRGFSRGSLPQEGATPAIILTMLEEDSVNGFRKVRKWLRAWRGATVVLPIFDAGSRDVELSAGTIEDDGTDGNVLGVTYDDPEVRKALPEGTTPEQIAEYLHGEVREYRAWAAGEMLAYQIVRAEDGEVLGDCGSYFTTEEVREVAEPELEQIAADALNQHIEKLRAQAWMENEKREWGDARKGAERALAVLRQADPNLADAELDHFGGGTPEEGSLSRLVVDVLHLAHRNGWHPEDVTRTALNFWHKETDEGAGGAYWDRLQSPPEEEEYDHSRAKEDGRNGQ